MWTLKQIVTFIRFAWPHTLRLVGACLWQVVKVLASSIVSLFRGIGPTANNIAEDWVKKALDDGFPGLWEKQLRATFRVLARVMIFVGWILILFTEYLAADYTVKWISAQ